MVDENEWRVLLCESYQQFELLDLDNLWINELIACHAGVLLPSVNIKESILKLLDEMKDGLFENPYFVEFLEKIPWENKDALENYSVLTVMSSDKNKELKFIKSIISFAFCLEKINVLLRDDSNVLELLVKLYKIKRKKNNFYRLSNILGVIKFHSIELPLLRFLKAKKKKRMSANFGKYILMLNIFEAMLVDLAVGLYDNAKSTFPLIVFSPNFKGWFFGRYQKGEPSTFSKDGKALLMFSPAPKEWADLYQVWNMAFVAQFAQAPYLLAKLIIPSVSRYVDRPAEYMHTRITALHLTMNYLDSAMNAPKIRVDLKDLGPAQRPLIDLWGRVNKNCSLQYKQSIERV